MYTRASAKLLRRLNAAGLLGRNRALSTLQLPPPPLNKCFHRIARAAEVL
jgi:hypothetical protein